MENAANDRSEANTPALLALSEAFKSYFARQAKRVLTQMDRDFDSPAYGCYDRNYWHYKIRDFPSSILQQGVFVTEYLRKDAAGTTKILSKEKAGQWSLAAISALSSQIRPGGRVDEYYPNEDSYPASAFALYASMNVLLDWKQNDPGQFGKVKWGNLRRLARNLAGREEPNAANQYAAGIAGLALAAKIPEMDASEDLYAEHASRLFSLQHSEGWFNEYGGPDFGYLSVTLDALTDYYDATGDERAAASIDRAIGFMSILVGADGELPWTLNARNTDYVVPYGLVRAAKYNSTASWLVYILFREVDNPAHWIWSTDDRYHLHYIFSSLTRAIPFINEMTRESPPARNEIAWLPGCGYCAINRSDRSTLFIAAKKGGLVRLHTRNKQHPTLVDHGWRLNSEKALWTTNWWQENTLVEMQTGKPSIKVSANMVRAKFHLPTPFLHFILRILSFIAGKRLIPALKKVLIFREGGRQSPGFQREIIISGSSFTIRDRLHAGKDFMAYPSPRQNLRHVASADSFHPEESRDSLFGDQTHASSPNREYVAERTIENVL